MRSIRAFMPILLLGLLAFATGTAAAETGRLRIPDSPLGIPSPCNNEMVSFLGTTDLAYHQNGHYAVVSMRYEGKGTDTDGKSYRINLKAESEVDPNSGPIFTVTYHAKVEGQGKGCDFKFSGQVLIGVQNGVPFGDAPISATSKCENGDGDHDRDDKDKDSDKDRH